MKTDSHLDSSGGRRRKAGFTLIELLTVIAIIGILAAIVIASVGAARRSAAQAEAGARLRSVGMAMQLYLEDNRGRFPGPLRGYQKPVRINNYQLVRFIEGYLGGPKAPNGTTVNPLYVSEAYKRWLAQSAYSTPETVSGADVYVMYTSHTDHTGRSVNPWGDVDSSGSPITQAAFQREFTASQTRAMWEAQGTERAPGYGELYRKRNVLFHDWHVKAVDPTNL